MKKSNKKIKIEQFGVPGQGRSFLVSIFSASLILLVWFVITLPIYEPETEYLENDDGQTVLVDLEGNEVDSVDELPRVPLIQPLFLPSPEAIVQALVNVYREEFSGGTLSEHTYWSVFRVFGAFFLSMLTAIPLGIMMGFNSKVKGFFDPAIEFYRPIPPLAYLPLTVIWFGIGEEAKIILIFLAIFAPMVLNTRAGVRSVPIEQIYVAYSLGASKFQVLTQVILKGAMPEILTGMRIGIGFGWTTLVAAELVAAEQGLGAMIKNASDFLVTDVVIMGIVIIGIIAFSFDLLMRFIESLIVPWKGKV